MWLLKFKLLSIFMPKISFHFNFVFCMSSVVLVAIALSLQKALFFVMSLLFLLSIEISTLSFRVNGFITILLLLLILIK